VTSDRDRHRIPRLSIERRIIPISSGKGGVGKTTIALNLALSLSHHAPTVLVDLDMGTSSVRNCLDVPVGLDLYHFFKKGHRLEDCVTRLDGRLDPRGEFARFGFIAAPKHMIEDITNFDRSRREQLIDAINELPATFVILDLKSGLDAAVIDFLPYSNSGILVFTPHLPAATLAASDIVKAVLFRKLRIIFAPGAPLYGDLRGLTPAFVNSLLDRVEDVYDPGVHNLDAFVVDLHHALGDHPVVKLVASAIESFVVHFLLNMFNGVRESYDTAVKPFAESLAENVSAHMTVLNLGWVIAHEDINQANKRRVPALLSPETRRTAGRSDDALAQVARLSAQYRGPRTPHRPARAALTPAYARPNPTRYLDAQLDSLRSMYENMKGASYRENFKYVVYRALDVMTGRSSADFGDKRIFKQSEIQSLLARKGR
jgi:MinD-like ATPase involved in chromosome partitioning or flagellar assembly